MNVVTIIGTFGNDPELKYLNNDKGTCIANFSIACNRYVKKEEKANWIKCKAIGKNAENIGEYFKKGHKIGITGELITDSWKNEAGENRSMAYVLVNRFDFLTKKDSQNDNVDTEQIPF